jgi:hypothetical protein
MVHLVGRQGHLFVGSGEFQPRLAANPRARRPKVCEGEKRLTAGKGYEPPSTSRKEPNGIRNRWRARVLLA